MGKNRFLVSNRPSDSFSIKLKKKEERKVLFLGKDSNKTYYFIRKM